MCVICALHCLEPRLLLVVKRGRRGELAVGGGEKGGGGRVQVDKDISDIELYSYRRAEAA